VPALKSVLGDGGDWPLGPTWQWSMHKGPLYNTRRGSRAGTLALGINRGRVGELRGDAIGGSRRRSRGPQRHAALAEFDANNALGAPSCVEARHRLRSSSLKHFSLLRAFSRQQGRCRRGRRGRRRLSGQKFYETAISTSARATMDCERTETNTCRLNSRGLA